MDMLIKDEEYINANDPSLPDMNREVLEGSMEGIADFFTNAVILVTGGTGFVGKALLEKLLRSCPGIDTVYVLMRPKRGLSVEQRYKELIKNQVFDRIRARYPQRLEKLHALAGDVSAPRLGLTDSQVALMGRVNTVFHSAATVRFTDPLRNAAALNVRGTDTLMKLARDHMPLLKAVVHVSTAYSNAPRSEIEERVYEPPCDPHALLSCADLLPPDTLDRLAPSLLGEHPNPYTLTKAVAETIVQGYTDLPVCIVRPSIDKKPSRPVWKQYSAKNPQPLNARFTPTPEHHHHLLPYWSTGFLNNGLPQMTAAYQEPYPGWIDNVYGVTGIIMEISRGTYRSGLCRERYVVDLVPVDVLVNCCILAAWRQAGKRAGKCPVYNVTSGSVAPLQWGNFTRLCVRWARENPTKYVMWYPNFSFTESRALNTFWELTCHFLPAFLYDLVLRAQGRKPIMMKLARRFKLAAATGEYFANHEWHFGIEELTALHTDGASAPDSAIFPAWPQQFSWDSYVGAYMLGIRRFILKDTMESLPEARSKLNKLYWIHRVCQAASGYYIFRLLAARFR